MENIIDRTTAIASLIGDTGWYIIEDEVFYTEEAVLKPADAEIQAEVTRLQAEYDSQEYARNRKAEYDLLNQDEMRYDDMVNNTTTWRDGIAAIKAAHPKP